MTTDPQPQLERLGLQRIAEAADADGREWEWKGGYPQTVLRIGDVVLIANVYESPDFPSRFAEFIATFDPPTVLSLLTALAEAEARVEELQRELDGEPQPEGEPFNYFAHRISELLALVQIHKARAARLDKRLASQTKLLREVAEEFEERATAYYPGKGAGRVAYGQNIGLREAASEFRSRLSTVEGDEDARPIRAEERMNEQRRYKVPCPTCGGTGGIGGGQMSPGKPIETWHHPCSACEGRRMIDVLPVADYERVERAACDLADAVDWALTDFAFTAPEDVERQTKDFTHMKDALMKFRAALPEPTPPDE